MINKSKKDYGYYCDVCGKKICKYLLDFKSCGGLWIEVDHEKEVNGHKIKDLILKEICEDCAKVIMEELLDSHGL